MNQCWKDNPLEKWDSEKHYFEATIEQVTKEESAMEEKLSNEKRSLKERRQAFGLTQTELGKMLDLSQMHISLVELGKLTFHQHQRAAIESLLGPVDWEERYAPMRQARCA